MGRLRTRISFENLSPARDSRGLRARGGRRSGAARLSVCGIGHRSRATRLSAQFAIRAPLRPGLRPAAGGGQALRGACHSTAVLWDSPAAHRPLRAAAADGRGPRKQTDGLGKRDAGAGDDGARFGVGAQMNTADLAKWFQLRRGVPEIEAVRLAEAVVIRRRELDDWWEDPFRTPPSPSCDRRTHAGSRVRNGSVHR